jgi:hypothetical protein
MKKMSLIEFIRYCGKYNRMDFNKDCSVKMAKLLVERFGFEDKKDYGGHHGVVQMFNWEAGDGTLFGHLEGWGYGKIEVGKAHDGKGWFCPDFD